jgi:hypothetical protein
VPRIELRGTAEVRELAGRLKAADDGKKLTRELNKALRKSAGPIVNQAKENVRALDVKGHPAPDTADDDAPAPRRPAASIRGGSAARTARYRMAVGRKKILREERRLAIYRESSGLRDHIANSVAAKTTVNARTVSLRVRAARAKMPDDQRKLPFYLNKGHWRHPVFGGDTWVEQTAPPAWFDDAGRKRTPEAADNVEAAVDEFRKKIL